MTAKKKDVLLPPDAEAIRAARSLIRSARFGALATLDPADGAPFATRVAVATDSDGVPVILVSDLSAHTAGLKAEPRCSLLVGEPGKGDPLAHPRLSLKAQAHRIDPESAERERIKHRYLNRHPKAGLYVDFADFSFYRLEPKGGLLNGGFARAFLLEPEMLRLAGAQVEAIAAMEAGAVAHMNEDHADAVENYARHFAGARPGKWRLTGIDPEGIDLALGDETLRIFFPEPLTKADEMRPALVAMAKQARAALSA